MRHEAVTIPSSTLKVKIAELLQQEGFIHSFEVIGDVKKQLIVSLKYTSGQVRVINGLKRISKPGLRVTAPVDKLPRVLRGLGVAVISTSKGIMSDQQAREAGLGGEVLAYVW
jgi:small subunit ribosomal protein S8